MSLLNGLHYVPNYISPAQEAQLINLIQEGTWCEDLRRRVQHYGYLPDTRHSGIGASGYFGQLPSWGRGIGLRLVQDGWMPDSPNQMIVNEYLPGQGITPHIDSDTCFGDTAISLSLGSACVMDFIHVMNHQQVSILLEARSLLILRHEARYDWQHGIAARKSDIYGGSKSPRSTRISLTFRQVVQN